MQKIADFRWTKKTEEAAITLADGYTRAEVAAIVGVSERTVYYWQNQPEFAERVDRLTMELGIAKKAERIRLAKRVIREKGTTTKRDLLDWLQYVSAETENGSDGNSIDEADWWKAADGQTDGV